MLQSDSSGKEGSKEITAAIIGAVAVLVAAIISIAPSFLRRELPAPSPSPAPTATLANPVFTALPASTPTSPSPIVAPSPTNIPKSVAGIWEGEWSSPDGYLYTFQMKLEMGAAGTLDGAIMWTLKKAPSDADKADLIGSQATEFVEGNYHPESRTARFEGQREDDPDDIIDLDVYRVRLLGDGSTFSGESFTGGTWEGKLVGRRMK